MEILNLPFPANFPKYFQENGPDIRNRNVITAILLSLMIHIWGGWLFLQAGREAPNLQRMRPIEVTIVTPTITPLPPPIMPKPAHKKSALRSAPLPVPVVPPKPAPVIERINHPQEINKPAEKTVQPSQSLPSAPSREKAVTGSQPLNSPSLPHTPAPVADANASGQRNGSEGLPVIGPRYDAAYLSNPAPQYPAAARFLKLQGTTTVRVLVSPEGRPKTVKLEKTSGARILDNAALDAVQHWLFVPARRGDKPVAAEVDVPVRFRLN
ncbi:MAG: TonB family protein [Geobacteraceae bacterium]|jgi:protein TonB